MHANPATAHVIHYRVLDSKDEFSCEKEEKKMKRKEALRLKNRADIRFNSSIRKSFLMSWFIHHCYDLTPACI